MSSLGLIGRYQLDRRLGAGGFAVVWLAHDASLDTPIAIKVLADNWADRMDLRERFLTEARMLRRAASNRVVQVFDIGELPDGRPYFVMEYADRGTLSDRAAASPFSLIDALRATAEVARGAAELHRAGIVHRDLKPSNVLIKTTPDGYERLMVADLGVAKNLAQASGLTMSVGSAGYMAPEQAGPNSGVDVRADVYSLGAIGYRLITGEHPALPGYVLSDRSTAGLPPRVRDLLQRALAVDREQRWPDAASLATALDQIADELSAPARVRPVRGGRRRGAVAGAIAGLVALGVAGAGIVEYRHPVRVHDVKGTAQISVEVPRSWSAQLLPTGWNPAILGLSGRTAPDPALTVAHDLSRWNALNQPVNGVFAGRSTDSGLPAAVARISHPSCRPAPDEPYSGARWTGTIRRWTSCAGSAGSLAEVSLVSKASSKVWVYVQIRQDGGSDHAREVLDSLRSSAA